ncbi:hypothetical protein [Leptolyngbya sp. FACHB-8]|uniref:hypothetical protein n=1 Tax=unclassified Leptolyngbya TaxID=2650499 RepID=UPI0016850807|nr:hypothetical protein [Leptolyngbya sp. FACHB-8]MBD1910266.1 hypothetical protein [Leptolyngbya sp. FACHB-8]MBD2156411.1 hypothetical protein [Leptolyngbya sp. FACHB-16]
MDASNYIKQYWLVYEETDCNGCFWMVDYCKGWLGGASPSKPPDWGTGLSVPQTPLA